MATNKTNGGFDVMGDSKKTVLVFGTFDGLHDGHRFFLREARKYGTRLIASVAADETVLKLKNKTPRKSLAERLADIRTSGLVDDAVGGDAELGSWGVVKKSEPEIIVLGYDQARLEKELRAYLERGNRPIRLIRITAHRPDTHHSSLHR